MKITRFIIEIEVPAAERVTKEELEPLIKMALTGIDRCQFQITQAVNPNTTLEKMCF